MAKQYTDKKRFSIIFCFPVEGSNEMVRWEKVNFLLPPSITSPTFKDLQNTFNALDTAQYINVLDALGLEEHISSTSERGRTLKYSELLEMKSDIIYYVK